ncbi:hypothetical protein E0H64_13960 [Rhizobium leguminosarum bv. viciae]|uniref:hypothetical protein n=1 Tax=Rhizobium leguminosarum TaxID=384 RepID=UPI0010394070|nr:hypothetical protein [Rhizobium leguminosarum]MBY2967490.1 hypothetical protein [Rhizobium leguminosarum]TBZ68437.1 hypothetical protein E0H64_13960 [Rhizobium leguminosarum bv. viciae]
MTFKTVKDLLDKSLADWAVDNGAQPNLTRHASTGHPPMVWSTAADLRAAWGKGMPLIQPEVVGKKRGSEANLVLALRTGVAGKPRMPLGGPYLLIPKFRKSLTGSTRAVLTTRSWTLRP